MQFRTIVEKYFGRPIKSFQEDWGGEYQALKNYLRDKRIVRPSSCPYTLNKMVVLKENIDILLKLSEHCYIMPMFHINFGQMHLILLCILSTVYQPQT